MKYFPQYQSFQCQDQLLVAPCKKKRSKLYEHYTDYPCSNCLERFKHHTQLARHKQQAHAEPNLINTPPSPPPDNHTQEPAQLGTFIRDLCLIDRHIYKPLLEVAKSILTLGSSTYIQSRGVVLLAIRWHICNRRKVHGHWHQHYSHSTNTIP